MKNQQPIAPISVPYPISWADEERDITAWLGNDMQNEAFNTLVKIGGDAAKKAIRPYAQSDNKETMYNAAFALAQVGEPSFYRFIKKDIAFFRSESFLAIELKSSISLIGISEPYIAMGCPDV